MSHINLSNDQAHHLIPAHDYFPDFVVLLECFQHLECRLRTNLSNNCTPYNVWDSADIFISLRGMVLSLLTRALPTKAFSVFL